MSNIIQFIKYKILSNKLVKLNKPIELMNDREIKLELTRRFEMIEKSNIIDNRTNELIENILNRVTRVKRKNDRFIISLFKRFKSFELRKEILERYSKYIDEESIDSFTTQLKLEEDRERKKRGIKGKRNYREQLSKKLEIYNRIIYSKNIEKINLEYILKFSKFDMIEKIYEQLPQEQKNIVLIELINGRRYDLYKNKDFMELIKSLPEEVIKDELLKDDCKDEIKEFFKDKVEITIDDVKCFYRKYGTLSAESFEMLKNDSKIYSKSELIEEAKYLKNGYRLKFLEIYLFSLKQDEIYDLLFDQSIDEETRLNIIELYSRYDLYIEKLMLFNKLDDNIKNNASTIFTNDVWNKENLSDISEREYINIVLSKINDEKAYSEYVFKFFANNMEIEPQIVFEVFCKNPQYMNNVYNFLVFTDEQIKILYEKASNEVQIRMLKLTREETDLSYNSEEEQSSEKEMKKYILVNEENYYDLVKNATGYVFIELLNKDDYISLLTREQSIEVVNKLIVEEKKSDITIDNFLYKLLKPIINNKSLDEIKNALLEFNNEKITKYILYKIREIHITQEELEKQLIEIGNINDKKIIVEYMNFLIKKYKKDYSGNEYDFSVDICNLLEKLIKDNNTTIENKYSYLYLLTESIGHYREKFGKKDYTKIVDLYKYINQLAGKEKYNEFLENKDFIYKRYRLLPYFNDDEVYDILTNLYESNHNVISTISPSLIDKKVFGGIDYDLIEFYSRYDTIEYVNIRDIFEDENKAIGFINIYKRLKLLKAFPEEDLKKIIYILNNNESEVSKIDFSDEHNIDKFISICKISSRIIDFNEYEEKIKEETKKTINNRLSSRIQLLDAIGKRFFNLPYKDMKEMVIKYGKDVEIFIKKYEMKGELTLEEQNELLALKTIRNFKEILNIEDKKAIIDTFNELDKDEAFANIDFLCGIVLDENVKRVFSKDYLQDIYVPNESDKIVKDGIEVYSPKEFNMFVHVIGAYSNFKLVDKEHPEKSAVEMWEHSENKQSHIICTSYIRNSNISYARNMKKKPVIDKLKEILKIKSNQEEKDIIVGLSNISKNAIQTSSITDMGMVTNGIESQNAHRYYTFRSADNLSNCTRIMYNEVDIERRLEENKLESIRPSYIVCFDEITEESKKVAKDFEIPIVYLNNREIAEREAQKLEEKFNLYETTRDAKILKDIIVQYMNNLVSFYFGRKDLMDEYFNQEKMTEKVNGIISTLMKEYKSGNKQSEEGLIALHSTFSDEIEKYIYGDNDPELFNCKDFDIRNFEFILRNFLETMNIDKKSDIIHIDVDATRSYQDNMLSKIRQIKGDQENER